MGPPVAEAVGPQPLVAQRPQEEQPLLLALARQDLVGAAEPLVESLEEVLLGVSLPLGGEGVQVCDHKDGVGRETLRQHGGQRALLFGAEALLRREQEDGGVAGLACVQDVVLAGGVGGQERVAALEAGEGEVEPTPDAAGGGHVGRAGAEGVEESPGALGVLRVELDDGAQHRREEPPPLVLGADEAAQPALPGGRLVPLPGPPLRHLALPGGAGERGPARRGAAARRGAHAALVGGVDGSLGAVPAALVGLVGLLERAGAVALLHSGGRGQVHDADDEVQPRVVHVTQHSEPA